MRTRGLILLLLLAPSASAADALGERLAGAAARLVDALSADARGAALYRFEDEEREDIRFAPFLLEGARHGALPAPAASLAEELLAVSLSPRGLEKARQIRRNEQIVAKREAESWLPGFLIERFRDPGRYFLALFGTPATGAPWGFRYEGHHLSLNLTALPGTTPATTPLFLGAQPRVVPDGEPDAGSAVLGEEEAAARALLAALPEALRARALLPYRDDRGSMLGQVRRVAQGPGVGVMRAEAPPEAQAQFDRLLELFAGFFAADIAAARLAEIDAAGRDALRFAWAEAPAPAGAFYARLEGPRTLIEIDNTTDGDHVHAVWHDPSGDFGDDRLAAHYRSAHALALGSEP
jgi:Protein of unknown function (DUF3500)